MKKLIEYILDLVYPYFNKIIDRTTFRYAACGGANTVFDLFLFFVFYNFVIQKQLVSLPFVTVSPHIASFLLAFLISFPVGFYLNKTIVFQESYLRGRVQLFRYFLTVCLSLILNYVFLKFFVEKLKFYPTPSKFLTTFFVVGVSYVSQKYFSFRSTAQK
ncbi:MAG: GtrA family protein [Chitinophagaceae bacterium]